MTMRRQAVFKALLLCSVLSAAPAYADVSLLAIGNLSGTNDLSGLTGTLENGLSKSVLGGLGSGLAYAGGNTFLALPDRGPNANAYNTKIDNTVSYISRFQTVTLSLSANSGSGLPFTLSPVLTGTTLLSSKTPVTYGTGAGLGVGSGAPSENTASKYYFSGRSDNFGTGGSGVQTNGRFDPESIRVSNDGKSVFISDEYGPYVRQFDRATGQLIKSFTLPSNLYVATQSPQGAVETASNTSGRTDNKGMEGLAITPDGKTLVGIMQAPLIQDASGAAKKTVIIVTIDIATGNTKQFAYNLTVGSGVSEIVALNDHQFLVDERDGKGRGDGSVAVVKQLFVIDTNGATDVTGLSGTALKNAAIAKQGPGPFLDIVAALGLDGIPGYEVPAKIEGLAFGEDVIVNGVVEHTLYVANDNDFLPTVQYNGQDLDNPNQIFVFGFTDADLAKYGATYVAQQITPVPEASTWVMMLAGFGGLGALSWRRRNGATRLA
jgi:hypothetical protein